MQFLLKIGLSDINADSASLSEIISALKTMPLRETVCNISSMLMLSQNSRTSVFQTDEHLRKVYLNVGLIKKIILFEQQRNQNVIVFARQTLLLLLQLARKYCIEGSTLNSLQVQMNIGYLTLKVTDFISSIEDSDENGKETHQIYSPLIIRQILFNKKLQPRYSIPRAWLYYVLLSNFYKSSVDYYNINDLIKIFGFSLDTFLESGFLVHLYWSRLTFENWLQREFFINPQTFFTNSKYNTASYLEVFKYLSQPIKSDMALPDETDKERWRQFVYEFYDLRSKPLLEMDGLYICSDAKFFSDFFWNSPYYFVLDQDRNKENKEKFLRHLGDIHQEYVTRLGKDAFNEKFILLTTDGETPFCDAIIQIKKDWIVIVEAKACRPSHFMSTGYKPITEIQDFEKMVKSGLEQIQDRLEEFRKHSNFTGRVTPLLITGGLVPQNKLVWDTFREGLSKISLFSDTKIDHPFILSIDDWEILCACVKSGIQISEIIIQKNKNPHDKFSNFGDFIFNTFLPSKKLYEPFHEILISLFEDLTDNVSKKIFNSNINGRTTKENIWQDVFPLDLS